MKNKSSFDNELRLRILTPHQVPTPVLLSHGTTRATLMTHRLVMAIFQTTLQRRKPSSITAITLAARLTSQMKKPISPSMMLTCRMVNSLLMSTVAPKIYRISSTASSSMTRLVYTIMVQGI